MAATADRNEQMIVTGEVDSTDDISDSRTLSDEGRPFVYHAIPDFASLIIVLVARLN
jgi:hypothetical protein